MKNIDLTGKRLLAMRDAESAHSSGASQILICENCVVTPSARDFLAQNNIALVTGAASKAAAPAAQADSVPAAGLSAYGANSGAARSKTAPNPKLFDTPEAEAIKKEICAVGRKLWMRQFVDGNGGNISYRIGPMRSSARQPWSVNLT